MNKGAPRTTENAELFSTNKVIDSIKMQGTPAVSIMKFNSNFYINHIPSVDSKINITESCAFEKTKFFFIDFITDFIIPVNLFCFQIMN